MPLKRWIWAFQIDLARSYFLLKIFHSFRQCADYSVKVENRKNHLAWHQVLQCVLVSNPWPGQAREMDAWHAKSWAQDTPLHTLTMEGGSQGSSSSLDGKAWRAGRGRERTGERGRANLQGWQAHLWLITTSQGMHLIELLPEAVRVTCCKDRAKPWGMRFRDWGEGSSLAAISPVKGHLPSQEAPLCSSVELVLR